MSRYIQEFQIGIGGGVLQVPGCAKFLKVTKVGSHFLITAEVWGDPSTKVNVEIRVVQRETYLIPELVFIDACLVGSDLFYFFYMPSGVLDQGSDGGQPPTERVLEDSPTSTHAGGFKEL